MSLDNYRYVLEYDQTATILDELIQTLLKKTWKATPSKNNFMPYNVHVVRQNAQELKNSVYQLCLKGESVVNSIPDIESVRYQDFKPQYYNIVSCSYLLIFTRRISTVLNPWQQRSVSNGNVYRQTTPNCYDESLIEMGMFSAVFSSLCLQYNLDISHTMCFSKELEDWKSIGFSDFAYTPTMLMTVGKGIKYRQHNLVDNQQLDLKPDFSQIVNFVS